MEEGLSDVDQVELSKRLPKQHRLSLSLVTIMGDFETLDLILVQPTQSQSAGSHAESESDSDE